MAEKTETHTTSQKGHAKAGDHAKARDKAPGITAKNLTKEEERFLHQHGDDLSKTTRRARWIHSLDEHEDHPGETLATRSHDVIMHWAEERGATPATVPGTEHADRPGVLRFDFQGYGGRELQQISWDDWFRPFDERNLVFLYQEHKSDGQQSNFFHLDSPEREHD